MVEKIKQFSLTILLIEIIFSSDLYAQSFKEKLKQAVRQEYNNAKQRNNNRNQYQKNSYRYNNNSQQYQNNSEQYSNKDKQKDSNNTENKAKSQDEAVLTVFGFGKTKDEATKIALRSAIEQAFGAFVSSNTQLLNDSLISDEIATVSSGNIKHYEYISEQKYENGYSVSLKATVSINKLIHYAESKGSKIEFGGEAFAMNIAMYELNKENEIKVINHLYKEISSQIPYLYDYKVSTLTPQKKNDNTWTIPVVINIYANKTADNIYKMFTDIFNSISLSKAEYNEYKKMGYNVGIFKFYEDIAMEEIPYNQRPSSCTIYKDNLNKMRISYPHEYYLRNDRTFLDKFEDALVAEVEYQTIAFKIIDSVKERSINVPSMQKCYQAFRQGKYRDIELLNQYCDSSLKIQEYTIHGNRESRFSQLLMRHSGFEVATIKINLIYNSLDEIKRLRNIKVEPTHKSFTELKYEQ